MMWWEASSYELHGNATADLTGRPFGFQALLTCLLAGALALVNSPLPCVTSWFNWGKTVCAPDRFPVAASSGSLLLRGRATCGLAGAQVTS